MSRRGSSFTVFRLSNLGPLQAVRRSAPLCKLWHNACTLWHLPLGSIKPRLLCFPEALLHACSFSDLHLLFVGGDAGFV